MDHEQDEPVVDQEQDEPVVDHEPVIEEEEQESDQVKFRLGHFDIVGFFLTS